MRNTVTGIAERPPVAIMFVGGFFCGFGLGVLFALTGL